MIRIKELDKKIVLAVTALTLVTIIGYLLYMKSQSSIEFDTKLWKNRSVKRWKMVDSLRNDLISKRYSVDELYYLLGPEGNVDLGIERYRSRAMATGELYYPIGTKPWSFSRETFYIRIYIAANEKVDSVEITGE